jgi:hypothetical protein
MKIIILICLLSLKVFAASEFEQFEERAQFRISPLALEKRFEATTDPYLTARTPMNFAIGIRYLRHITSLEYSKYGTTTGNETFRVERNLQDVLGWYKYALVNREKWRFLLGAGVGAYQEEVTTYFYDLKKETSSGSKWTTGALLGGEYEPIEMIVLSLEARLIAGQNLDPNPNPSVLARLTFQF